MSERPQTPLAAVRPKFGIVMPGEVREQLLHLCEIGHVRSIQARLADAAKRYPGSGKLIARLQTLIDEFDIDQFITVLENDDG